MGSILRYIQKIIEMNKMKRKNDKIQSKKLTKTNGFYAKKNSKSFPTFPKFSHMDCFVVL